MKIANLVLMTLTLAACSGAKLPNEPNQPPADNGGGGSGGGGGGEGGSSGGGGSDGAVVEPRDMGAPHAHDLATEPHDLAPPTPTKKVLPFTWQGEQMYYMCGPSAARMALSARMAAPPTQAELASYMGTTSNGTDDIGLVKGALDHYLNITAYQETDLAADPPTAAQQAALKKALVDSIDGGFALVANVVSGWRPPGYPPSGTIYHYIALVGYDAGGDKVLVADPAATGCGDGLCGNPSSGFYNVPQSYWINTSDLGVWITPKGYTFHP